jgi:nucleoside-diphosphate-sugar epimerase
MGADKAMDKIYVAGHRGMVGSAIVHTLQQKSHAHVFACLTNAMFLTQ